MGPAIVPDGTTVPAHSGFSMKGIFVGRARGSVPRCKIPTDLSLEQYCVHSLRSVRKVTRDLGAVGIHRLVQRKTEWTGQSNTDFCSGLILFKSRTSILT